MMWYALVSVGSFVAGIAVTLFFAAVIADDPFPPSRTELREYLRHHQS